MIRLTALWASVVAVVILVVILREERLARQGKVPLGRLRRLWLRPERRRAPRYRIDWPVRYQRAVPPPISPAQTRDISATGAGLVVRERLEVGSFLSLEFTLPGQTQPLTTKGKIIWTREIPSPPRRQGAPPEERLFLVGLQFQNLDRQHASLLSSILGTSGLQPMEWQQ